MRVMGSRRLVRFAFRRYLEIAPPSFAGEPAHARPRTAGAATAA